jgi:adenylylsulfate reductase subunit A
MVSWCLDNADFKPAVKDNIDDLVAEIYLPMEIYGKHKGYTTAPDSIDVNPNYIKPRMMQFRLMKIMDEYVGGISTWYTTSKTMLDEGLKRLTLLKEDSDRMAAKDLHELLRCWENYHRIWAAEAHARHIMFREETRYPGYYFRGDYPKIDDVNWKCFNNSKYDPDTGDWVNFKKDYVQIVS